MDNRYEREYINGKQTDRITVQALEAMEEILGYELTILQGGYRPRSAYSASTHSGGGVVDLSPYDHEAKVAAGAQCGFAAFHRTRIPGLWEEHVHMVLKGDTSADPSAQRQVISYEDHRDALVDNGPYQGTWHPIKTFAYDPSPFPIPRKVPGMNHVQYGRKLFWKAYSEFDRARDDKGRRRPGVVLMQAAMAAAAKAGPKK